jgi:hypothetical protein
LANYYEILGVNQNASTAEIKSAFRALAKIYHPDKNPDGQEDFKKILRAYETLINPSRRASYDLRLKHRSNSSANTSKNKSKNWTFEEKEMRRRQYYNEHIKKYAKSNPRPRTENVEIKSGYNEYKYILFATPVAVALFLLIMNLATPSKSASQNKVQNTSEAIEKSGLSMRMAPYLDYFGSERYNTANGKSLTIKNNTGLDVIVCIFNEKNFVRSCFIGNGYFAEIPQLPLKPVHLRYCAGSNWDSKLLLKDVSLYGAFASNRNFYKSLSASELGPVNEITLTGGLNKGFASINEKEFFSKENIYD